MWVLARDPTVRHWFVDDHDHRGGVCDLAEQLAHDLAETFGALLRCVATVDVHQAPRGDIAIHAHAEWSPE